MYIVGFPQNEAQKVGAVEWKTIVFLGKEERNFVFSVCRQVFKILQRPAPY